MCPGVQAVEFQLLSISVPLYEGRFPMGLVCNSAMQCNVVAHVHKTILLVSPQDLYYIGLKINKKNKFECTFYCEISPITIDLKNMLVT